MQNLLGGYRFITVPQRQAPLLLAGVSVSINLDLLAARSRAGREEFGGVLLRATKPDEDETQGAASKRREMGIYAATLAQMQARAMADPPGSPHHELCMSIDVQCGEVHTATRNSASRASRLEAACKFIAAMWASA